VTGKSWGKAPGDGSSSLVLTVQIYSSEFGAVQVGTQRWVPTAVEGRDKVGVQKYLNRMAEQATAGTTELREPGGKRQYRSGAPGWKKMWSESKDYITAQGYGAYAYNGHVFAFVDPDDCLELGCPLWENGRYGWASEREFVEWLKKQLDHGMPSRSKVVMTRENFRAIFKAKTRPRPQGADK
jgi:hypothetical protein